MNKKLLIVKPDGIGDFVIFLSVIEEYKRLFKDYTIDIACNDQTRDLATAIPFINKVICFDFMNRLFRKKYRFYTLKSFLKILLLKYDKVIYPVYSRAKPVDLFIRCIRAKEKIAFYGDSINDSDNGLLRRNSYYSHIISGDECIKSEFERNYEIIKKLGSNLSLSEISPRIWFSYDKDEYQKIAQENNLNSHSYIAILPGTRETIKYWDNNKWAELIQKILFNFPEYRIVFLGYGADIYPIKTIMNKLKPFKNGQRINLCGKTNLRNLSKIIANARMLIGTDTGAIHIAAAVGTPNVCIMGGGHFGRYYPYGNLKKNRIVYKKMDCFGCNWKCIYDDSKCIKNITVDEVFNNIERLL